MPRAGVPRPRPGGAVDAGVVRRQAEDGVLLPRRTEDRMPWLLDRVARQTYTRPAMHQLPEPSYGCGEVHDEYGRCRSRFHGNLPGNGQGEAAASGWEAWAHD